MYQQLQFADARDLAEQVMDEVTDEDPASTARLHLSESDRVVRDSETAASDEREL